MTHPLVEQLRFARSEWRRGLRGVPEAEGFRRFEPINSIVGHMASKGRASSAFASHPPRTGTVWRSRCQRL
jgi:hypothetical protein